MNLPQQRLPFSKKGKTWQQECMDYFSTISQISPTGSRTSNYRKIINYNLFNGKFNRQDLQYVCNPLGVDQEFPATLQHYDIISPAIMLLLGEETKRPDSFVVLSEGEKSINRKTKHIQNKILESLYQSLTAELDPESIDPNNPPPTPEQILKYEKYSPSDIAEVKANKILKETKKKLNTKLIFSRGFKDALISGEEIYWTGINNGCPDLRKCNPANMTVLLDSDSDFIDDAFAVIEDRYLSITTILDEFGDELTTRDIADLEDLASKYTTDQGNFNIFRPTQEGNVDEGLSPQEGVLQRAGMIKVTRVEWMSLEKFGILNYTDNNGIPQSTQVDESFDFNMYKQIDPVATIEWFWRNQVWEGIKIDKDKYVAVRPKQIQRRRTDNPYYAKLGYSGLIYNATNSISVSLIDRLKPYQYLYNILMYRLELAFASDQGKIMLMDLAQIPRSEGMNLEQWMYYLKAAKIAFINSFEEGKGKFTGQRSTFNTFQEIDLSLANTIQQYINSLEYIKQQVAFVSGISPQRLGAIHNRESVGGVERAVNQSALITEYWFDAHNEVKRRVYTSLIECAKIAYKNGYSSQFVLDDMGIETLIVEPFELEDVELSVYVTDSAKDASIIQDLKGLFQAAIQADKAGLSDVAKVLSTDSVAEITRMLEQTEAAAAQRQAEAGQLQNQAAQEAAQLQREVEQAKLQLEYDKLDREDLNQELDRENDIQLATIKAMGFSKETDMNSNMIPDVVEQGKLALEHAKLNYDQANKDKELLSKQEIEGQKNALKKKEIDLKEKDIKNKERIEKLKIKQTEVQNRSQERIAKEANKLKEKELKAKIRIERIKARNKPKSK